jgi:L,D-transpeptidase catalytic domain.
MPVLILAVALPAATAQAQTQTTPPAKAKIVLDLQKVGHVKRAVAFAGKAFRVRGQVYPYVANQVVHIRVYRGNRMLLAKTKRITALPKGTTGNFVADFRTNIRGRLRVGVTHDGTKLQHYAHAHTSPVEVIGASAYPGQTGHTVQVMQRLLRDIGYVPGQRGSYDDRTARAVLAFRKMSGLARVFTASRTVLRRLINGGGQFEVRYPGHGRHAEADLAHQVLALIDHGKVEHLYPISSGKPSTPTVLGHFRIYSRVPGYLPDGMYYSNFFIRGYAIHGYDPSPTYPASHGCLRAPIPDAHAIYDWLDMGDRVDVYYRTGHHRHPKPSPNAGP